jgi:hypothetical protein
MEPPAMKAQDRQQPFAMLAVKLGQRDRQQQGVRMQ